MLVPKHQIVVTFIKCINRLIESLRTSEPRRAFRQKLQASQPVRGSYYPRQAARLYCEREFQQCLGDRTRLTVGLKLIGIAVKPNGSHGEPPGQKTNRGSQAIELAKPLAQGCKMPAKIFIDGDAGTTGLSIRARLKTQPDIELLSLPRSQRKDPGAKKALMEEADIVILCLPDEAAREAVAIAASLGGKGPRILDASTAHRVAKGWTYGFPELAPGQAKAIARARRVANPGCYATGVIALLRPLVDKGLLPADHPVSIHAVSGYSGGGKKMIADYERGSAPAFEAYALGLEHKHVPEIERYARLARRPIFAPSVGNFANGMLVCMPLFLSELPHKPKGADLEAALAAHYQGSAFVKVKRGNASGKIEPQSLNGTDDLELRVFANDSRGQAILVAKLDNLGKGGSGAALQNLRLMLREGHQPAYTATGATIDG
jgi:N-acetyl-gamma-glutamyl-phosphate reductase